ncbi:MAG: hypothetical protein HY685_05210 [Chloroflexi bacterium]|nr:hypothetical protein [Chloroflexota bacterium]
MFRVPTVVVALAVSLALASCGAPAGPQSVQFDLAYQNGKLNKETFTARQGDSVVLKIKTDTFGEFHLHGYDLETDIAPDEPGQISVTADATGKFKITFHEKDPNSQDQEGEVEGEEEENAIGFLEVQPR